MPGERDRPTSREPAPRAAGGRLTAPSASPGGVP